MTIDGSQEERLRESLVQLEQLLGAERKLRAASEALLDGMRCLASAGSLRELDETLLLILRTAFEYEQAALLVAGEDGSLTPSALTSPVFEGTRWRKGRLFQRVITGHPAAVFDVCKVDEWAEQPPELLAGVGSAIHIPLSSRVRSALIIGTHARTAFFSPRHVDLARRFARMAVPTLDSLAAHEQLRLTAEARAELLERTNDTLQEQLGTIRAQQEEIQRLTAPVLTMWRKVLVVPIVGSLSAPQAARMTERLLRAIAHQKARVAIVDVTGVEVMDESITELLQRLARAVALLGAVCFMTGVRPAVAQALVGTPLDGIRPFNTLADGLTGALRYLDSRA